MEKPEERGTDLSWVDGFVGRIRPYVYVRESDNVLIRMPNQAFKLNRSGCRVLKYLLERRPYPAVLAEGRGKSPRWRMTCLFFSAILRPCCGGRCASITRSPALNCVPFELGYIERPILSEVALTYDCNVSCRFCYAGCECVPSSVRREEIGRAHASRAAPDSAGQDRFPQDPGHHPATKPKCRAYPLRAANRCWRRTFWN